MQISMNGFWC